MLCGNCIESEQCHHINGTCMNGCDRGYQGLHCTQGKYLNALKVNYCFNMYFSLLPPFTSKKRVETALHITEIKYITGILKSVVINGSAHFLICIHIKFSSQCISISHASIT